MTAGKVPSDEGLLFSVELLTIPQVAKWARVSTKTIYRWIESGRIPVVKFGERTYILPILALLFVLPSVSQSYASAKQAQAVIETSRSNPNPQNLIPFFAPDTKRGKAQMSAQPGWE